MTSISVILPIGPLPRHSEHLQECLESITPQLEEGDEIVLIDNGLGLREPLPFECTYRSPWAIGLANGYNVGVALAKNELCFFVGSDDRLMPNCLSQCKRSYEDHGGAICWYFVGVQYSDGRDQNCACMAAMISKTLWRRVGGFELGSDYGMNSLNIPTRACESIVLSKMMINPSLGEIISVGPQLLYWVRLRDNYYSPNPFT